MGTQGGADLGAAPTPGFPPENRGRIRGRSPSLIVNRFNAYTNVVLVFTSNIYKLHRLRTWSFESLNSRVHRIQS